MDNKLESTDRAGNKYLPKTQVCGADLSLHLPVLTSECVPLRHPATPSVAGGKLAHPWNFQASIPRSHRSEDSVLLEPGICASQCLSLRVGIGRERGKIYGGVEGCSLCLPRDWRRNCGMNTLPARALLSPRSEWLVDRGMDESSEEDVRDYKSQDMTVFQAMKSTCAVGSISQPFKVLAVSPPPTRLPHKSLTTMWIKMRKVLPSWLTN